MAVAGAIELSGMPITFGTEDGIKLLVGKTLAARPVAKGNWILLTTTEGRTYHVFPAHFSEFEGSMETTEVKQGGAKSMGEIASIDVVEIAAVPVSGWDTSFPGLGLRFHSKDGGTLTYRADTYHRDQDGDNAHTAAWEWSVMKITEKDGSIVRDYERKLAAATLDIREMALAPARMGDGAKLLVGEALASRPYAQGSWLLIPVASGHTFHVFANHFQESEGRLVVSEVPGGVETATGAITKVDTVTIPAVPVSPTNYDTSCDGVGLRLHVKGGGTLTFRADASHRDQDGDTAHTAAWEWSVVKVTGADGVVVRDYSQTVANGRLRGKVLATIYSLV